MTAPTGGLTGPEERLIGYIAAGTLDAEIAVRLGVPVGEVKDRTERLVRKLNLPDRAALATFDPATHPETITPAALGPVAESAEATPDHSSPRGALLGLLATGVLAVAAFIAVAFLSDNSPSPLEGASPTRTPTPEGGIPTATPIHETDVQLEDGGEFDLFDYSYLYLAGCLGDECEPRRIERVSRQGREEPATTILFQPEAPACITSAAASRDTRHVFVSVNLEGDCLVLYDSNGVVPPEATTAFFYSDDGGVTWTRLAELRGTHLLLGVTRPAPGDDVAADIAGLLLFRSDGVTRRYARLGLDGAIEELPEGRAVIGIDFDGAVVWGSGSTLGVGFGTRIYRDDGTLAAPNIPAVGRVLGFVPLPDGRRYLLNWTETDFETQDGSSTTGVLSAFWGVVDRETGALIQSWAATNEMFLHQAFTLPVYGAFGYEFTGSGHHPILLWLDGPVVYELSGDHWPSVQFGYQPLAIRLGPFAEVASLDGPDDCLYVRPGPGPENPPLGCYRQGTQLLIDTRTPWSSAAGFESWLHVYTPDGREGYASAEFLDAGDAYPVP